MSYVGNSKYSTYVKGKEQKGCRHQTTAVGTCWASREQPAKCRSKDCHFNRPYLSKVADCWDLAATTAPLGMEGAEHVCELSGMAWLSRWNLNLGPFQSQSLSQTPYYQGWGCSLLLLAAVAGTPGPRTRWGERERWSWCAPQPYMSLRALTGGHWFLHIGRGQGLSDGWWSQG